MHLCHQLEQEHFITIRLKLIICYYPIVLVRMLIIIFTLTETDTLLADTLINIGEISLPGMLDIGTSGYTNSRIRCNADIGGYTGYGELRAANSFECGWSNIDRWLTFECTTGIINKFRNFGV